MQCVYITAHLEEHFPHSLEIEGNHEQGLTSFYTVAYVLPLFLVWILLLVCSPIKMFVV